MGFKLKRSSIGGATLVEVLIAAVLVGVFFGSIFEVNAICLHYISASKENITGLECVQDRLEQVRNLDFASLTNATTMATYMSVPSNSSALATQATETVTISTFDGASATSPSVTYTRGSGASLGVAPTASVLVAPTTTWSGGSSFGTASLVRVDVKLTWNSAFGRRPRSETSSTIISAGTKK